MTARDHRDIQNLYYFHRLTPSTIARLYGLSHVRIGQIVQKGSFSLSDVECILCGLEEIIDPFYIDGDENNHNPQNVIMLCEADTRRMKHRQLKRKLKSQSLSSQA